MSSKNYDDEIIVEDSENFRSGESMGIKEIALEQYRRCCIEGSKEMNAGGLKTKIVKGVPIKVDAPNQREVFINAVKMMEIILMPDILGEKKIVEELSKINKEENQLEKDFNKSKKEFGERYKKSQSSKKPLDWNENVSSIVDEFDSKLVGVFRNRLVIHSKLLNMLNYYGEASAYGG